MNDVIYLLEAAILAWVVALCHLLLIASCIRICMYVCCMHWFSAIRSIMIILLLRIIYCILLACFLEFFSATLVEVLCSFHC
jgi:hypothetical protein